jgi:spore coat protein U-like protein
VIMMKRLAAAAGLVVLVGATAQAATINTTFGVTANLQATCSTTAAALAFGAYTPGAGARTGNTTINVRCTKNTPYTVALNVGTTAGGSFAQRLMASGANTLQYNLYTSAAFASIFGDGTASTVTSPGTGAGLGTANTLTVFGNLPDSAVNQAAVPGSYTDTITVTVTY